MLYLTTNRLSLSNSKSSHQVNTKETPHYTRGGGYHFPYPHSQPDSGTINFWEWNGNADLGLSFLSHSQRVVLSFILLGSEQARTHRVSMLSHPFALFRPYSILNHLERNSFRLGTISLCRHREFSLHIKSHEGLSSCPS